MAVTRHCRSVYINTNNGDDGAMADLQLRLNKMLGPHERIVHMQQTKQSNSTWYVITEELVMGPSP